MEEKAELTPTQKSNAALVTFLLSFIHKDWLEIYPGATKKPYVKPKGWSHTDIPYTPFDEDTLQLLLDQMATIGTVGGLQYASILRPDGTRGPGSMLDTLQAAWAVFHWLGTRSYGDGPDDQLYTGGGTECFGKISEITNLRYLTPTSVELRKPAK